MIIGSVGLSSDQALRTETLPVDKIRSKQQIQGVPIFKITLLPNYKTYRKSKDSFRIVVKKLQKTN